MISLLCLAAATLVGNALVISPTPHPEDSIVEFVSDNFFNVRKQIQRDA